MPRHDFYSYEAKYLDADGADLAVPADLDEEVALPCLESMSRCTSSGAARPT